MATTNIELDIENINIDTEDGESPMKMLKC